MNDIRKLLVLINVCASKMETDWRAVYIWNVQITWLKDLDNIYEDKK